MILRTPFTNRLSILAPPDRLHAAACSDRLGEFILALSLNLNEKIQPITVALNKFSGQYGTRWNEMMAVSTTVAIPIVIVFVFLQRFIVSRIRYHLIFR